MPDTEKPSYPGLEARFLPPPGWRWHNFTTPDGKTLRFGSVSPANRVPDAIVIGLQGLGEFSEKYFEVAQTLLEHNLSFWTLDWRGQGRSERLLEKNPHKRHSSGFEQDVEDLHFFINEYVKHSAVHPDVGRIPLVMLGHSMGGNIGLHYLNKYPGIFSCAAFSAPMTRIKAVKNVPNALLLPFSAIMNVLFGRSYVGFQQGDWNPATREAPWNDPLSSDPIRKALTDTWCTQDPALQIGHVTYGWVYEAIKSCTKLQKRSVAESINVPCLFALAEKDTLVDNKTAHKLAKSIPHADVITMDDSWHEILMERDEIRDAFFEFFTAFLKEHDIKSQLKPF